MRIISKLEQEIRNVLYEVRARTASIPLRVVYEVPYVCQFALPEHAELSLKKQLLPVDDEFWQNTGAASPERYAQWAFTMCGMACTCMALEYFKGVKVKVAELAEDALRGGVYTEGPSEISNMRYAEFAEWIKGKGIEATVYTRLSLAGIRYALSEGKLVVVSVNPNIRGYDTAPTTQKGGHLVLVVGYDTEKDTITINNPSGFVSTDTQIKHTLKVEEFMRYYACRGILLASVG